MLAYLLYKCMKFVDKSSKSDKRKHVQKQHFYYPPENVYFYYSIFYTVEYCEENKKTEQY